MRAKMQIQSVTLNGYTEIVAMSAVYGGSLAQMPWKSGPFCGRWVRCEQPGWAPDEKNY